MVWGVGRGAKREARLGPVERQAASSRAARGIVVGSVKVINVRFILLGRE
jgi:hypothetical protein